MNIKKPYPDTHPNEYERRCVLHARYRQQDQKSVSAGMIILGLMALVHIICLACIS